MAGGTVDFFFGPGSRYSYLASTQLARLAGETGAVFRWRAVFSADLIAATGRDPFGEARGPYDPGYRSADVERWARLYGVRFTDFDVAAADWRRLARACAAAELLGSAEAFGWAVLQRVHVQGRPSSEDDALAALARTAGLDPDQLLAQLASEASRERQQQTLSEALAAGAFGVPTFVTADGALFFGQDRLPLLRAHLLG